MGRDAGLTENRKSLNVQYSQGRTEGTPPGSGPSRGVRRGLHLGRGTEEVCTPRTSRTLLGYKGRVGHDGPSTNHEVLTAQVKNLNTSRVKR